MIIYNAPSTKDLSLEQLVDLHVKESKKLKVLKEYVDDTDLIGICQFIKHLEILIFEAPKTIN